jgi:hypothetical protein
MDDKNDMMKMLPGTQSSSVPAKRKRKNREQYTNSSFVPHQSKGAFSFQPKASADVVASFINDQIVFAAKNHTGTWIKGPSIGNPVIPTLIRNL